MFLLVLILPVVKETRTLSTGSRRNVIPCRTQKSIIVFSQEAGGMANQASLFESDNSQSLQKNPSPTAIGEPLAARMRPRTLDEILGQEQLLAPDRVLRRSIEGDHIPSMILWGPPGSGKTTLAEVIARQTKARFVTLSSVSAAVAALRR